MTASTDLQPALHEDEEPIQMVTVPPNMRQYSIVDEPTFKPHHVTYDDMMFGPSGSTTAISAISEGLAHRQDTLEEDSNEAAASTEEETITAEEMEADEVSLVERRIKNKEVVQVPAVCRGCGAPVLSQAAIKASCKLGRTPNNSPMVRAQPEHELTSAFLEKHMVTAEMPQREVIFYHGQSAWSVNRAMK
ncbi:hypothetical protein D9Q98_001291 [Chlorella vulgaris]|uniref:Uncharacterized protein n=1 Tax=Chlorella vulgaris TaxID=3077 RepID=A0A9D4TZL8_CHLVU|nr:hypothetical protein D9Q98_001291 [Chlorella vulgaris]